MRKLLKFERRKLFGQKSFYICLVIAAAMTLIAYYVSSVTAKLIANMVSDASVALTETEKDSAWTMASNATSDALLGMLVMIHLTIFACLDRSQDTLKNIYAKGYTRRQVFYSKYIVAGVSSIFIYVLVVALNFIIGLVTSGHVGTFDKTIALTMFCNFLDQLTHITIYFCVSMAVGKFGGAFAINVAGTSVIGLACSGIDALLHLEKFKVSDLWVDSLSYNISTAIENSATSDIVWGIIGELIYIVIFIAVGRYLDKMHRC